MFMKYVQLLALCATVLAQKCDHTPKAMVNNVEPQQNELYELTVLSQGKDFNGDFQPDQKYAVTLRTKDTNYPFRWFMITVEDPAVDDSNYAFRGKTVDVGKLKTLDNDHVSKYTDACINTVVNVDSTEKEKVSVHWLSPKGTNTENVRIRAMVATNAETWFIEPNLSVELKLDKERSIDRPPRDPKEKCGLCSEARYEVIFKGQWSRLTHPQRFPINTDNNAYSYMVGASHGYDFTLWEEHRDASPGLKRAAETADTSELEKEVLNAVGYGSSNTRTLIRGRKNAHPNMTNPSHALFRVDPVHHLFSVVIALQPSPDWFLGAQRFELCRENDWMDYFNLPLYPWDAGTVDGVSYDSARKAAIHADPVGRVALGSFDRESPFYQLNLNDLVPFGHLKITRLDVYPLKNCNQEDAEDPDSEPQNMASPDEEESEPEIAESRADCGFSDWEPWSTCSPDGHCGSGNQFRTRYRMNWKLDYSDDVNQEEKCIAEVDKQDTEYQECYVDCY